MMRPVPPEPAARSVKHDQELTRTTLNLLHALPYPLAVCRKSDGCMVAANHHFYDAFGLPHDLSAAGAHAGFCDCLTKLGHDSIGPDAPRIEKVDADSIQIATTTGRPRRVKATVTSCRYGDQDCWMVTAAGFADPRAAGLRMDHTPHRYRDLIENLNDIIYTTDTNAVVTYVSPNIRRLSGYTPEEVIGRSFIAFVHPDDLSERMEKFLKILGGAHEITEYRLLTKSGQVKWARTNARPIMRDGQVVGLQGILVDITDRKEIEDALKRSEKKYRLLVQHAKDAIFVIQGDHIKFMNPSASDVLGYTCDGIARQPFIRFVHPDDRAMILDRYQRRLRGEKLSDRVYFRILAKDDDVRDVELNAVLISWEGKPAVLNFFRDITHQKRMETQVRNSQKMEALGILAGGIAHNFNNLLMGINGNTALALGGLDEPSPIQKYLERINRLVESGSKLTAQLLDYARGGKRRVDEVVLNRLVTDASETLAATKQHIRIHLNLAEDLPCIKADQGQIEQVLLNLLLNAADAMPQGGEVFIETACIQGRHAEGKVSLSNHQRYLLLKVADGGTGIPKAIIDRIFEPFFTTKGLDRGTGLGLSTVYGIVKNHNGGIWVESEENRGTTFFVYLPVSADTRVEPRRTGIPDEASGQGTVLLIDDDRQVLDTSSLLLELLGYCVLKAEDGSKALEIFKDEWRTIDLVILDLILPTISGWDLFSKLKRIDPRVKVLLSSGFGIDGQAEQLMAGGCCGFIQKPYNIKHLSVKIMEILSPAERTAPNDGRV